MQAEMANLAERIVEPVTAKLAQKELDAAVDEIRHAFEQLRAASPAANVDFRNAATNILEPVRSKLCEGDFTRIANRLRGAMAGFCQRDEGAAQPDGNPSSFQQAGQREAIHLEQNAQSEPEAERWWGTSEQAMALLILLRLCTELHWQLP
jgi:hypothetical protein